LPHGVALKPSCSSWLEQTGGGWWLRGRARRTQGQRCVAFRAQLAIYAANLIGHKAGRLQGGAACKAWPMGLADEGGTTPVRPARGCVATATTRRCKPTRAVCWKPWLSEQHHPAAGQGRAFGQLSGAKGRAGQGRAERAVYKPPLLCLGAPQSSRAAEEQCSGRAASPCARPVRARSAGKKQTPWCLRKTTAVRLARQSWRLMMGQVVQPPRASVGGGVTAGGAP